MSQNPYPNLLIVDRPQGSMVVRARNGTMLMVARKEGDGWAVMTPNMVEPALMTDDVLGTLMFGLNHATDPSGVALTRQFTEFMTGSR